MVTLKRITELDIEQIRGWRNSDLIQNVSINRSFITAEAQKMWYDNISEASDQIHWLITANEVGVGYAAIKNIDIQNKKCEFASLYIGNPEFLLNGTGAQAEYVVLNYVFSKYPEINEMRCEVLDDNRKVIQLHKRFGFVVEPNSGNLQDLNSQSKNVILMVLLKEKWETVKPTIEKLFK